MNSFKKNIFFEKVKKLLTISKKILLINLIIFLFVFGFLISLDQITKNLLFNTKLVSDQGVLINGTPQPEFKWAFITVQTVPNLYVTSGIKISSAGYIGLGLFGALVFLIIIFYSRKPFFTIATTVIFTGILGNTIDRMVTFDHGGYVKDIFSVNSDGTFNLADIMIVSGACGVVVYGIFNIITTWNKDKENTLNISKKNIVLDNNLDKKNN